MRGAFSDCQRATRSTRPAGAISVNTRSSCATISAPRDARELREQSARAVLGSAAATDVEIVIIAVFMTAR